MGPPKRKKQGSQCKNGLSLSVESFYKQNCRSNSSISKLEQFVCIYPCSHWDRRCVERNPWVDLRWVPQLPHQPLCWSRSSTSSWWICNDSWHDTNFILLPLVCQLEITVKLRWIQVLEICEEVTKQAAFHCKSTANTLQDHTLPGKERGLQHNQIRRIGTRI